MSNLDKRCCGSGVCIINEAGECWCGQRWDGTKMSFVPFGSVPAAQSGLDSQVAADDQTKNQSGSKT